LPPPAEEAELLFPLIQLGLLEPDPRVRNPANIQQEISRSLSPARLGGIAAAARVSSGNLVAVALRGDFFYVARISFRTSALLLIS